MRSILPGFFLYAMTFPAIADTVEFYCKGLHNDGSGAPVLQTHLWLKLSKNEQQNIIELLGPSFEASTLAVEESPTTFSATHLTDDGLIAEHITLNRQTLDLRYSRQASPDLERAFVGFCTLYSPKI